MVQPQVVVVVLVAAPPSEEELMFFDDVGSRNLNLLGIFLYLKIPSTVFFPATHPNFYHLSFPLADIFACNLYYLKFI